MKPSRKTIAVCIILIAVIFFLIATQVNEHKTQSGELLAIKKYPTNDGGTDVVLLFNNSGGLSYLVINEWRTGMMVELEYRIGRNIDINYLYYYLYDKNVMLSYGGDAL